MPDKPTTEAGYTPKHRERARSLCLYLAAKLGDLMDSVTVVGGLVPTLLGPGSLLDSSPPHVGTIDVDLALAVELLTDERYKKIAARLRRAGFVQDQDEHGYPTRQRWRFAFPDSEVATVDFLMPSPSGTFRRGVKTQNLEPDFAAWIMPGLELAFRDRLRVTIDGILPTGGRARRDVFICGPAAFLILKAIAFRNRHEPKDAYDLFYVLSNFRGGVPEIGRRLEPLQDVSLVAEAIAVLRSDFQDSESTGTVEILRFLGPQVEDPALLAQDVVGLVARLLALVGSR